MTAQSRDVRHEGLDTIAKLVQSDESVRSRSDVQIALARMLQTESQLLTDAAARGEAEDDPYLESYFGELMTAARLVLPYSTGSAASELLATLLDAHFNTDTEAARAIASVGQRAASPILRMAGSSDTRTRHRAYDLLGQMLGFHRAQSLRKPLSPKSAAGARRSLLRGLRDPEIVCRREAVRGVERAGLREAVPILEELEATDPDDGRKGYGPWRFSVRGLAAKAIATLSKQGK